MTDRSSHASHFRAPLRIVAAAPMRLLAVLLLSALLAAACAPTQGDDGSFVTEVTTSTDFLPPVFIPVGNEPITVAVADYDGDGDADIAVVGRLNPDSTVNSWLRLLTMTTLSPLVFTETPWDLGPDAGQVFWGNFGGAATPLDLMVVINTAGSARLWFCLDPPGCSAGTTQFEIALPATPQQVTPVDLNGIGGITDVVMTFPALELKQIGALVGPVTAGSTLVTTDVLDTGVAIASPGRFVTANFDVGANLDLAILHASSRLVSIWLGDGAGNFTAPATTVTYTLPYGVYDLAVGDFIGSGGFADLAVSTSQPGNTEAESINKIAFLKGLGTGLFTAPPIEINVGLSPRRMLAGDLETGHVGDELLVLHNNQKLVTFLNEAAVPPPDFDTTPITVSRNPFAVVQGTFALSAAGPDVAVVESVRRVVSILDGDGAGVFDRKVVGFDHTVKVPVVADLDGLGGNDDLVLLQPTEDTVVLLLNAN